MKITTQLLPIALLLGSALAAQSGTAVYELTHVSTWSKKTHPTDFPSFPHYSPLIGGLHDAKTSFWKVGGLATKGIESMAETGSPTALRSEVQLAIKAGGAKSVVQGPALGKSPGSVKMRFTATAEHSHLTLVTMLAPSPDWFVGVSGLSLMKNGRWVDSMTVDLHLYDAGTDDGTTYTSANKDSNPKQKIAKITTASGPFKGRSTLIGSFVLKRVASSQVYGCGVNPKGSMTTSGAPLLGQNVNFGLDDPGSSMSKGSATFLFLGLTPATNFPCGVKIGGFGLSKPGSVGELLLGDIAFQVAGPKWNGSATSQSVTVPNENSIIGVQAFVQGALVDGNRIGVTDAVEIRVGK